MKSDNTSATSGSLKLYVHDHLYSPVALVQGAFLVLQERYEYDAYGNCQILSPSYEPRATSDENNPYLFTASRLDILDNGSLKIQYNRNRYYDQYTARWYTHDPLGITPNPQWPNRFYAARQHGGGLNLYEVAQSSPQMNKDPHGLLQWSPYPGTGYYIGEDRFPPLNGSLDYAVEKLKGVCDRYNCKECCKRGVEYTGRDKSSCYSEARKLGTRYYNRFTTWTSANPGYHSCMFLAETIFGWKLDSGLEWFDLKDMYTKTRGYVETRDSHE